MAAAFQSVGVGVQASDTTSITITKPTGLTEGDLMIASISKDGSASNLIGLSGWEVPAFSNGVSQIGYRGTVLTKIATSGDVAASDFTFTWSGSETASGSILRIDGHHPVHFLDVYYGFYNFDAAIFEIPGVHVRHPGSLYVFSYLNDNTRTYSKNILTERVEQGSGGSGTCSLYVGTLAVAAAGSPDLGASMTLSGGETEGYGFAMVVAPADVNTARALFRPSGMR